MIILDEKQTGRALPYKSLIEVLREGSEAIVAPERQHHRISVRKRADRTLITMPAWDDCGNLGIKLVNILPDNGERQLPSICALYVVFDSDTGEPAILLNGPELTARRTAAVSALAGDYLAGTDAKTHLVVGAGAVARHLPGAFNCIRKIERTLIWARNHEKAEILAADLRNEGINAVASDNLPHAASEADIVSCATMANEPFLDADWLRPGVHVDLIGSYLPHMREAQDNVVIDAEIWVDSVPGALTDSGELAIPIKQKIISESAVQGNLAALIKQGRCKPTDHARTLFKSVGNARWDFICAKVALQNVTDKERNS